MPAAIAGEHLPTEVGYNAELQSGQHPGEDDEHTVSDSLCRNSLVVQTHSFISCLDGWSQMIPQVKKPGVEVRTYCSAFNAVVPSKLVIKLETLGLDPTL